YWATTSVDPAAPPMGIQGDGFVTSELKRSDAPAPWALSARADGGPTGLDRLDTSRVQVSDRREIPRVLSQPGDQACGHGWAGNRSGEGEKSPWPSRVGRRRHGVADCSVEPLFPEHDTATPSKRGGGGDPVAGGSMCSSTRTPSRRVGETQTRRNGAVLNALKGHR